MALDLPGKLRRHENVAVKMTVSGRTIDNEPWIDGINTAMIPVWYYRPEIGPEGVVWFEQKHVDDHETFLATVDASLSRRGSDYALWSDEDQWCLLRKTTGDTRRYKHREAAEMVAIHNG